MKSTSPRLFFEATSTSVAIATTKYPSLSPNANDSSSGLPSPEEVSEGGNSPSGLISHEVSQILILWLYHISIPIIQMFGITTNSINLRVFWSVGLKDVATSCFFALSFSDLCYLCMAHLMTLFYSLHQVDVRSYVTLDQLSYYMSVYVRWLMAISTSVTVYIAVQRCCCVALPLKVKSFFTPNRNIVILVFFYLLPTAFYLPSQTARGMKVYFDPSTNESWVGLYRRENYEEVLAVTDYLVSLLFPISTQTITVLCMGILITSLRKSAKFRRTAAAASGTVTSSKSTGKYFKDPNSDARDKIKSRDVQVVKAVTFVTLMFIISNTLSISIGLARRFEPNFRAYLAYRNIFIVVDVIRDVIQQLNASLNIFVYYHFNSTYRSKCKSIILCRIKLLSKK